MRAAAGTRGLRAAAALAACWIATAGPVAAQQQQPAPAPPAVAPPPVPEAPAEPAALPLSEIPLRLEPASRRLREIGEALAPDPSTVEIEEALASGWDDFSSAMAEIAATLSDSPPLDVIADLDERVGSADRQLERWQGALGKRTAELEQLQVELGREAETWKLTLARAEGERAPSELLSGVRALRKQIKSVQKRLAARFDVLLTLQSRIGDAELAVSLLESDLRRVRSEVRGRVLERDRAPLHGTLAAPASKEPLLARIRTSLERDLKTLQTFADLQGARLWWHAAFFAASLLVAIRLRSWVRARRRQGKSLGPSEALLDRPISVALLAAFFLSPWIYPYRPRALVSVFGLLLIVPVLVLLPRVLVPELWRLWYSLAVLFLLDRLRDVVATIEPLERTIFLGETLAATVLVGWLLRTRGVEALVSSRWQPVLRALLRAACAALVVSSVANLAGWMHLARLLGDGVLRSAYTAVLLYGVVHVASLLVAVLLRTSPAGALRLLKGRRERVEQFATRTFGWIGTGVWAMLSLQRVALEEPVADAIAWLVRTPVQLGSVSFNLGDVLVFGATIGAAILVSRFVGLVLEEEVFPRTRLARGVPYAISATVRYGLLLVGFLLAAAAAGFEWNRVTLLAGAFGVGIGFGLQNIVNNFVSGLILLYERPIQVGDTVEVGALMGEVRRIGIRSSTVRTWQGAEVIVPNANLIAEQVVNWTLSDRQRRIDIPVGVAYGTDPERVIELLREAAVGHPDVLEEPAPTALFRGFGESSLDFELRVWTVHVERLLAVRSQLVLAIHAALDKAGVQIPFPQRDLHLKLDK